eukprot:10492526-Alexandrium_andersonii.AAC.1
MERCAGTRPAPGQALATASRHCGPATLQRQPLSRITMTSPEAWKKISSSAEPTMKASKSWFRAGALV